MSLEQSVEALRYLGLFSSLDASSVMSTAVYALHPEDRVAAARILMRENSISGVPIVDDNFKLVGIISVSKIIEALADGRLADSVDSVMTRDVVSLRAHDSLETILSCFQRFKFGRFPVVEEGGKLVGMITDTDVLSAIVRSFYSVYVHDQKRMMTLGSFSALSKEFENSADLVYDMSCAGLKNAGEGSARLKAFLQGKGFSEAVIRRASVCAYEAEINVCIHAGGNGTLRAIAHDGEIIVRVEDNGPGIENIDLAMKEGWSTATDAIREMGFGAGMGLPNIRRFSDHLVIISGKGKPTKVEMIFLADKE
ncbi:MAG: CBS domain-containing protein [Caldiserica bacterium]|nr:CBS domain-containing protein [Caldisericota bacterium]